MSRRPARRERYTPLISDGASQTETFLTRPDPTSQMAPPRRPGHQVSSSSHYLCPRRNLPVPLTGYGRSGASARPRAIRLLPVASTPQVGVSAPSATSLIYPRTGGRGECAQTCVRSPLGVLRSTGTRGVVRKSGSRPRCIVVMCCVRRYQQATLAGLPAGPRRRGPPCGAPYLILSYYPSYTYCTHVSFHVHGHVTCPCRRGIHTHT